MLSLVRIVLEPIGQDLLFFLWELFKHGLHCLLTLFRGHGCWLVHEGLKITDYLVLLLLWYDLLDGQEEFGVVVLNENMLIFVFVLARTILFWHVVPAVTRYLACVMRHYPARSLVNPSLRQILLGHASMLLWAFLSYVNVIVRLRDRNLFDHHHLHTTAFYAISPGYHTVLFLRAHSLIVNLHLLLALILLGSSLAWGYHGAHNKLLAIHLLAIYHLFLSGCHRLISLLYRVLIVVL